MQNEGLNTGASHDAFLARLALDVAERADPAEVLRLVCERMARHLGASRAGYATVRDDGVTIQIDDWADGVPSMAGTYETDPASASMIAYRRGKTLVRADWNAPLDGEPASDREMMLAAGNGATVGVPLLSGGRLAALFAVHDKLPRAWSADEVRLIEQVARFSWRALEHLRALESLRESEEQFRTMADNMPAICWVGGKDGVAYWMNRAGLDFFGQVEGQAEAVVHPDDIAMIGPAWDQARRDEQPLELTVRTRGADGVYRPLLSRAHPIRDAHGTVVRWCGVQVDLSTERTRKHHEDLLRSLSEAARETSDAAEILALTAERLGRHLGASRVAFTETDPADRGRYVVERDWTDGIAPSVIGAWHMDRDYKPLTDRYRRGETVVSNDVLIDGLFEPDTAQRLADLGLRSGINVPLIVEGELVAVLLVQQRTPREWSSDEIGIVEDVAERTWAWLNRARSEERLAESEALLAGFLENAPIGMYLKGSDGRFLRLNQQAAAMLGTNADEATGRTPAEALEADLAAHIAALDELALQSGTQSAEFELPDRDTLSSLMSVHFPVEIGDAQTRVGGFTIDLTDRKRAEAALSKSREALFQSEKLTALGSLLAGVSHELNNPLSIVVAQAVMLERMAAGTETGERAVKIRKAAERCARIVQAFLAMARQKRPEHEATDINAVVSAALELAEYGLRIDGIEVERQLAPDLPPIAADADQLHQILVNLVINAQQAMAEPGLTKRRLTLRTVRTDDWVSVDVIDSGRGVPEGVQRRIFEPFFTTKPQGQGTGIGLSFSQGLAEAHGGRLELLPSKNGAHFRLSIPVNRSAAPASHPAELSPAPIAMRRALVVDDEPEIAEALADFLSLEGFECEIARGGAQARAMLSDSDYDLIVSDVRMPDVDGAQLFAWLTQERPELIERVAFATGDTLGADAARFLTEARRPVLEKPFMPAGVARLLKQMALV